jgi:hypothetical protein
MSVFLLCSYLSPMQIIFSNSLSVLISSSSSSLSSSSSKGDKLHDLINGEQCYAVLEAMNSLDGIEIDDMYDDATVTEICDVNEISIKAGYEFCVREGFNLPFGVMTNLRIEQSSALIEADLP